MVRIILLIILLAISESFGAFNILNPTAKTLGMGNSFVAVANDINSIHSNPAGLVNLKSWEALFSYSKLNLGISNLNENFIAAGIPFKEYGSIGLGWYNFNETTYYENVFYLAYAYPIKDGGFGINIKYLNKGYTSNEWTEINPYFSDLVKSNFSLGLSLFSYIAKDLAFGFFIDDFNEPNVAISGEEKLPMTIRGGVSYNFGKILLSSAEVHYRNYQWKIHLGNEIEGFKTADFGMLNFFIGGGVGSNNYANFTAGIGYKFNIPNLNLGGEFDYGFLFPIGFATGNSGTHKVSLTIKGNIHKELEKQTKDNWDSGE